jgi:hypothetical protein
MPLALRLVCIGSGDIEDIAHRNAIEVPRAIQHLVCLTDELVIGNRQIVLVGWESALACEDQVFAIRGHSRTVLTLASDTSTSSSARMPQYNLCGLNGHGTHLHSMRTFWGLGSEAPKSAITFHVPSACFAHIVTYRLVLSLRAPFSTYDMCARPVV